MNNKWPKGQIIYKDFPLQFDFGTFMKRDDLKIIMVIQPYLTPAVWKIQESSLLRLRETDHHNGLPNKQSQNMTSELNLD